MGIASGETRMSFLPPNLKATLKMRAFGLFKIPLLFFVRPSIIELNEKRSVIEIRLSHRSKNHLNSMYFGALAIGADLAVGMLGFHIIELEGGGDVHLSFKDFKAEFLKRPEGHVHFICEDGEKIRALIRKVLKSGERINIPMQAYAIVPSISDTEPVAKFVLTLSLKRK